MASRCAARTSSRLPCNEPAFMKKNILEIYSLTVCFFAVVCFVFVSAVAIYDAVQVLNPEFTLSRHQYERYLSNEGFIQTSQPATVENRAALKMLPREEIARRRTGEFKRVLRAERHEGKQTLFRMVVLLLFSAGAFAIHWQVGHVARQEMP
jgi:hypothetical protein